MNAPAYAADELLLGSYMRRPASCNARKDEHRSISTFGHDTGRRQRARMVHVWPDRLRVFFSSLVAPDLP